jgi:hypothetical protein
MQQAGIVVGQLVLGENISQAAVCPVGRGQSRNPRLVAGNFRTDAGFGKYWETAEHVSVMEQSGVILRHAGKWIWRRRSPSCGAEIAAGRAILDRYGFMAARP